MTERPFAFSFDPEIVKRDDYPSILKMKQENRPFVLNMINEIIHEKYKVFAYSPKERSVCLVGHSQLDQWSITELNGFRIRNCAVSGISSFEYKEKILQKQLLNCDSDCFIVMHGTNDIVWNYSIEEIVISIKATIDYIKSYTSAPIIFVACMHVNGRLDRSNIRIDELNNQLKLTLNSYVVWLDTAFMDNQEGVLDRKYTEDGLHITDAGYKILKKHIEKTMKEIGL